MPVKILLLLCEARACLLITLPPNNRPATSTRLVSHFNSGDRGGDQASLPTRRRRFQQRGGPAVQFGTPSLKRLATLKCHKSRCGRGDVVHVASGSLASGGEVD